MMEEWEEFSAFGDIAELEHVCELLEDCASALRDGIPVEVADLVGSASALVGRLEKQDVQSAAILIAERPDRPGLYAKTWMAKLIAGLYLRLSEIAERPEYLPDELPRLELDFHKVLIAAHDIFDPHHRATLITKAAQEATLKGAQAALRERQSNAGKASKRSAGIVAAIKQLLQDQGGSGRSAEQVWRKLGGCQEETPLKVDGYQVFMDEDDGESKLRSLHSDGSRDGRPLVRKSFDRVFSAVKKSMQ